MQQSEVATSAFPVWTDEKILSAEWLSLKTGLNCKSSVINTEGGEIKGMSGATLIKLVVTLSNGEHMRLVIK